MRIKKFFFALPLAFMAIFFAFCAKEQQAPIAELPTNDGIVGDRQCCAITVTAANVGPVALCGVQTNAVVCNNIGGVVLRGTDQWNAPGVRNYNLCFPNTVTGTLFQVSGSPAVTPILVTVTSAANSINFFVGGGFPIRTVNVGSNCMLF